MASLETPGSLGASRLQVISGNAHRRRTADRGIVHAKSEDGLMTWTHTAALFSQCRHPEILLIGLDPFLANTVLCDVTDQIAHGATYDDGSSIDGVLHRLTCVFRTVAPAAAAILMPAIALGSGPALQMVYPDPHNRLPWDPGFDSSWSQAQPLFLAGEPMGPAASQFLKTVMRRPHQADRRQPGHPALLVRSLT